ncbi:GNAT family N-acetyltransferase [Nonomuraea sp. NPDC059194]|uniref:GNAT family N-acetyltransferase n=1 Tax=Nonomuraea sp. NPDC059194 TaxID=3346764 RepID=UPI0036A93AF1
MEIQRIDLDPPGDLLAGLHAAFLAALAELPGPRMSLPVFTAMVARGFPGDMREAWAVVEDGRVVAGYGLGLPTTDNTHLGVVRSLVVVPERRRRGLGRALVAHAADRARTVGRRLLQAETPSKDPADGFARAMGFTPSLGEARRVFDLRTADRSRLERMLAAAEPYASGYRLEQWAGPAGPELHADLALLMEGMNDAPQADDIEDMTWDAERIRVMEAMDAEFAQQTYSMIARRAADGAVAGYTRIYVDRAEPDGWGRQADTVVLGEHRGHRLGLVLKLANLLWFGEMEPEVERIITWNATSNSHMLAINEAMGFELLDEWCEWQREIHPTTG